MLPRGAQQVGGCMECGAQRAVDQAVISLSAYRIKTTGVGKRIAEECVYSEERFEAKTRNSKGRVVLGAEEEQPLKEIVHQKGGSEGSYATQCVRLCRGQAR